jgi:TIR domain
MAARREGVFVSYAREDERWALWVGKQMMRFGFDVELDKWSWRGGDDFVERMRH